MYIPLLASISEHVYLLNTQQRGKEQELGMRDRNETTTEKSWILRCYYTTVDTEMHSSQNGFGFYVLPIHKTTYIIQSMTKDMKVYIFFHWSLRSFEQNMIIWHVAFFVEFFKYRFVMLTTLQSPLLWSSFTIISQDVSFLSLTLFFISFNFQAIVS
jgi:hypothetical protein